MGLLQSMRARGLPIGHVAGTAAIKALGHAREWQQALTLFDEITGRATASNAAVALDGGVANDADPASGEAVMCPGAADLPGLVVVDADATASSGGSVEDGAGGSDGDGGGGVVSDDEVGEVVVDVALLHATMMACALAGRVAETRGLLRYAGVDRRRGTYSAIQWVARASIAESSHRLPSPYPAGRHAH